MKIANALLIASVLSFLPQTAWSQPLRRAPATAPAEVMLEPKPEFVDLPLPKSASSAIDNKAMPDIQIAGETLDSVLESIRKAVPGFNSVLIREPNVLHEYPTLPQMQLKGVTIGQFLVFVESSFRGVHYRSIDGPNGPLYLIRISTGDGVPLEPGRYNTQAPPEVHVYRLTDAIRSIIVSGPNADALADPARFDNVTQDATNQILTLLQAALDQTEPDGPVTLKVHEPTQTLIYKGSYEKQRLVESTLSALRQTPQVPVVLSGPNVKPSTQPRK